MHKSVKRMFVEARAAGDDYQQAAASQEKAQEQLLGSEVCVVRSAAAGTVSNTAAAVVRLRKSCDSCVRLKRACNGESPCHLCARMGKLCSRSAKKRSGPPKGTKYQARRNHTQVLPSIQQTVPFDGGGNINTMQPHTAESGHLLALHGAQPRISKRWAGCDQGKPSFVRRVARKIHHEQDPSIREIGNEKATQPAVEAEDGARLLLRTLKTFHPLGQTLGLNTNLERLSRETSEEQREEQERLPSLFDLGAVSSPAYLSDAPGGQVYGFVGHTGHQIASEEIILARPQLAEIAHTRTEIMPTTVDDRRCHRSLPGRAIVTPPMMAVPSFPRYLHSTIDGVRHAGTQNVVPQYHGDGRAAWAAFGVKTPYSCVFDPYAQDWMPAPPNFTSEGKSRSHFSRAEPSGSVARTGDRRIGGHAFGALYHRVDAGGVPAAPAGNRPGAPGMRGRFERYVRSAMCGNIRSSG